jgi:exonuclease SbcC
LKIVALQIEAFRGYRERVRFDFSASSVILLYGPNGHGKTSFFDAIEWALSGNLYRFSESTDERNQSRFIGNSFTRRHPCVQLELFDELTNVAVKIVRTGTANERAQTDYGASKVGLNIQSDNISTYYEGEQAEEVLTSLLINKEWSGKLPLIARLT